MPPYSSIPIESPGINVAVVRKETGGWQFLLLKRAETETYAGFWGFVTGRKEGSESVAELAMREVKEETGLMPYKLWASEYCVQFYEPTVDRVWILPVIVAEVSDRADVTLSEENAEFRWVTAEESRQLVVWQNVKEAIWRLDAELRHYPAGNWVELPVSA